MPRFMLDTDTCSYIMKRSHPLVLKRLQSFPVDDVCMSVVTKAELLYGVEVSPRRAQDAAALAAFLPYVEAVESRRGRRAPLRGDPRGPEAPGRHDRRQRPVHRRARQGPGTDAGHEQHGRVRAGERLEARELDAAGAASTLTALSRSGARIRTQLASLG